MGQNLAEVFEEQAEAKTVLTVPKYAQQMMDVIEDFEDRAWDPNISGLRTGWDQLDKALEYLQTGWHVIAADSNMGKTSFISQLAWQVATHPDNKAFVMDFSLDDPMRDKLPRVVAAANKVLINAVKNPLNYQHLPQMIERRNKGMEQLKDSVHCYKCFDSTIGTDIEVIFETIKEHKIALKKAGVDRQIVVTIDNFHDLTTTAREAQGGDKNKYDYLAQRVSDMATMLDIPIITTAELRKINGNRRPILDDIRESVKIKYEAKSVLLCYNEVGLKGEGASVYFELQGNSAKQPVYEVKIDKNKFSSFKGRLFFEFYPDIAWFNQAPPADAKRYSNLIYSGT